MGGRPVIARPTPFGVAGCSTHRAGASAGSPTRALRRRGDAGAPDVRGTAPRAQYKGSATAAGLSFLPLYSADTLPQFLRQAQSALADWLCPRPSGGKRRSAKKSPVQRTRCRRCGAQSALRLGLCAACRAEKGRPLGRLVADLNRLTRG